MFFRSERLFLRPGWSEDWSEVFARIADEGVAGPHAGAPWPYSAADARALAEIPQDGRHPNFLITVPTGEGAQLAGCIGLSLQDGEAELGYWIARDQCNRGYATEAARAVLSLARTLGHRRITAAHYADSPASGQVLRKIGFVPTGETRPRFSIPRGGDSPALIHAIELGRRSDCDGGSDDDAAAMRAA